MRLMRTTLLAVLALTFGTFLSASAIAQVATPGATPGGPSGGFPVAVHQGTCTDITAQPVVDIGNATAPGTDEGSDVETVGQQAGPILTVSQGTIDMNFDDLANGGNVIAIHASSDDYETIVACGAIAGIVQDDKLAVPLAPIGESTTVGVAILETGDEVNATVYLFDSRNPETEQATPEA